MEKKLCIFVFIPVALVRYMQILSFRDDGQVAPY